ncbi:MAG: Maf family protein [Eubacteriales bacterium]|nr:Maf family protein [Eubacteriales bacterium]
MIILASKSPRRREIMEKMGYNFIVTVSDADETLPDGISPKKGVEILALRKAEAVLSLVNKNDIIVCGDTLVDLDGKALGKPKDEKDALDMLMSMSGKTHCVHTGVAVLCNGEILNSSDTTYVTFRKYSESEALAYVKTGEPMDKAGAYGIQGLGSALVERVDGDMDTVIGLPSKLVHRYIEEMKYRLHRSGVTAP